MGCYKAKELLAARSLYCESSSTPMWDKLMLHQYRYFEAARLCAKLGRRDEALEFAESGVAIDRDCLGEDHDLYRESVSIVAKLRREL